MTDNGVGKCIEIVDHLGPDHNLRHEDEKRDGTKDRFVELAKDSVAQSVDIPFDNHQDGACGQAKGRKDRNTGE